MMLVKNLFPAETKGAAMHVAKTLLILGASSILTVVGSAQTEEPVQYDSSLARRLNADQYGMKKYVMAFLKRGPNRSQDSVTAANLQRAHLQNIERMANEGKLVLAGPFLDNGEIRGIYIFNVETVEEAKALTETDPAIQAGRLVMELHPWYGSAAVQEITALSKKLQRRSVSD